MPLEINEIGTRMRVPNEESAPQEPAAPEREALVNEVVERTERDLKDEGVR